MLRSPGESFRSKSFMFLLTLNALKTMKMKSILTKSPTKILVTILLAGLSNLNPAHAGSHTWSGAVNNSWSNAGNWSAGGAPQYGEANVVLIYPANAVRYASTNGIGNIAIDLIEIDGNNYSLGGYGITLTGAG